MEYILCKSRTVATHFRVPQFSKNKRPLGGMGKVELFGSGLHPYGMHPETKGLSQSLPKRKNHTERCGD